MQSLLATGVGLAVAGLATRARDPVVRIALLAGGVALAWRAVRNDRTLALLADPYRFIGRTCEAEDAPAFATQLLLERTVCVRGPEAARLFYDESRFQRAGAMPEPVRATLMGQGAVQSLDGPEHRHRKAFFLEATRPDRVTALARRTRIEWDRAIARWQQRRSIRLYDEAQEVLTRAVCAWAGVPLDERDVKLRTRQFAALFDAAAGNPMRHLEARLARKRLETWLARLIEDARSGRFRVGDGSLVSIAARWTALDGRPLPSRVAATELLNVLRPTVAIAVYVVFAAHALTRHPGWRERIAAGESSEPFVQEVRRWYPFFPAVMARVRRDFDWAGVRFARGTRAVLDLHGTNHDPDAWPDPHAFRPDRFLERPPPDFAFVPQGGGDVATGHRCPGEGITTMLMKIAIDALVRRVAFDVPRQDLRIDFGRLPALPGDGFVMTGLRHADEPAPATGRS